VDPPAGDDAVGMPKAGHFQGVADAVGVGEARLVAALFERAAEGFSGFRREGEALLGQHAIGDGAQLVDGESGKSMWWAMREHTPVRMQEAVQRVLLAGQDHYDLLRLVVHDPEEDLDGHGAEVAPVVCPVEV